MTELKEIKKMDCIARTHFPGRTYCFKWILEHYSRLSFEDSPKFYPEIGNPWWLKISTSSNCLYYLQLTRSGHGGFKAVCDVFFAGSNGKILKHSKCDIYFDDYECNHTLLTDVPIEADVLKESKDVMEVTIILEMNKIKYQEQCRPLQYCFPSEEEFQRDVQKSILEDLEKLHENHSNTDVSLSIEGNILHAHKTILSARSSVFSNMFQQEMVEATDNVVVIEDVKMATMKEVVAFMYGKAKRDYSYDTAMEMYYAADKYDVRKLKEVCGAILASQLNEENAGDILNLADRHDDKVLKERVMNFMVDSWKSCVVTKWWGNLMSSETELAAEVAAFIAQFK